MTAMDEILEGKRKEEIRRRLMQSGAVAVGFAESGDVDARIIDGMRKWIGESCHAGMDYLPRHLELKRNPENVLAGAKTVISLAFSYAPAEWRDRGLPMIACYAYGDDYHDVIRARVAPSLESLREEMGGEWRLCVDSAPIAERYWAVRAGIGVRGRNGSVIVENFGSYNFLAEAVTTLRIAPDEPAEGGCMECGACVRACPAGALREDGTVDSRRCLSYLTIEHHGDWDAEGREAMSTTAGGHTLFGCDICHRVCPHNQGIVPSGIGEFSLRNEYGTLTAGKVASMTQEEFSRIFRKSAIKRAKLAGLLRNVGYP